MWHDVSPSSKSWYGFLVGSCSPQNRFTIRSYCSLSIVFVHQLVPSVRSPKGLRYALSNWPVLLRPVDQAVDAARLSELGRPTVTGGCNWSETRGNSHDRPDTSVSLAVSDNSWLVSVRVLFRRIIFENFYFRRLTKLNRI